MPTQIDDIIHKISTDKDLKNEWSKFSKNNQFAKYINYEDIIEIIELILVKIEKTTREKYVVEMI